MTTMRLITSFTAALTINGLALSPIANATTRFPASAASTLSIQIKDSDMAVSAYSAIEAGGFKIIRKGIYWSSVEKTKGVYNFKAFDAMFDEAAARDIAIHITLFGNNSLYEPLTQTAIVTEAGRQGFANFAAAVAAHYKNRNVFYEIWNEPNLGGFWQKPSNTAGIAAEYTALVKAVVPKIKAADPAAFVEAGSISCLWSDSYRWFDAAVASGLLTSGLDAVSVHPYGFNLPEQAVSGYNTIRAKLDAAGGSKIKIVTSEVGYNIDWIVERQKFTAVQAEDVQGWMLVRQQLVDVMNNIVYSNWYQFRDSTGQWPVMTNSYAPLPGYEAAQTYSAQLNGFTYDKRIVTAKATDYLLQFKNKSGALKLVAWSSAGDSVGSIDVVGTGSVAIVSVFGQPSSSAIAANKVSLTFEGAPKYIDLSTVKIAAPITNISKSKAVTTSSNQTGASHLVDGVISNNSRWFSSYAYPQTVEIDLAGTFSISSVSYQQAAARTKSFKVEVYNGKSWVQVSSGNSAAAALPATIAPAMAATTGSKVRFTVLTGSLYQKVFELVVNGTKIP